MRAHWWGCNHELRMGKGWLRCECGARCQRDLRGKIIRFGIASQWDGEAAS